MLRGIFDRHRHDVPAPGDVTREESLEAENENMHEGQPIDQMSKM